MKISELSKQTNVSIRMIRYYEQKGLLKPTRTPSGYRRFKQEDIAVIHKIKMFKAIGFTIDDILPVFTCQVLYSEEVPICDKLREKFVSKIEQIDKMIINLNQAKSTLAQYI